MVSVNRMLMEYENWFDVKNGRNTKNQKSN